MKSTYMWERVVAIFWTRVDKKGSDDCWPWRGAHLKKGYGSMAVRGRKVLAHRLSYWIEHGKEPSADLQVRHSCDNPPCVNPAHLLLGTVRDNYQDMIDRGRQRGGAGPQKLTAQKVDDIRRRSEKEKQI